MMYWIIGLVLYSGYITYQFVREVKFSTRQQIRCQRLVEEIKILKGEFP
jgi:uncharacterized membrane protein